MVPHYLIQHHPFVYLACLVGGLVVGAIIGCRLKL